MYVVKNQLANVSILKSQFDGLFNNKANENFIPFGHAMNVRIGVFAKKIIRQSSR